ncbi:MexX family efflux pump subunit [Thermodesulfomicrobium sp. WS]|uniref:efflux RND transporter periplasmic adaptor subunit n=1 Tax=Thermodesulfomicrobium sp. WS TaxID=3004129 RepID=UPI0024906471|nr:efflux RND transporter periplasmic adaptor subunit [Thermodesulfomicrobium sp. WS]BDV00672.1 MexX family efflux pump subunit [Thermodesulfomicrobium sp. WS]
MNARRSLAVVLVISAVIGFVIFWKSGNQAPSASAASSPPPEVAVVVLREQEVRLTAELPGRATAYAVAEIRPQVTGIIQKRLFAEGTEVRAGQPLYQIDPASYRVAVASAAAALAKAKAELEPIRLKATRYAAMVRSKAVSQQDNDDAQAALALARAEVKAAEANLEAARIDLARTTVTAPISGRISRALATPGALVTANQAQSMAIIHSMDPIYVDLTQSHVELLRLRQAIASGAIQAADTASVHLILEDGYAYPLPGTLELTETMVDTSTGTVTLRAVFPNPHRMVLPGMYVRAIVEYGTIPHALCIPEEAVLRDARGAATVLIVDADDRVEMRPVELDRSIGNQWVVRSGLTSGDRVIVQGVQKIRPGMEVRIANSEYNATNTVQAPISSSK